MTPRQLHRRAGETTGLKLAVSLIDKLVARPVESTLRWGGMIFGSE